MGAASLGGVCCLEGGLVQQAGCGTCWSRHAFGKCLSLLQHAKWHCLRLKQQEGNEGLSQGSGLAWLASLGGKELQWATMVDVGDSERQW